MSKRGDTAHTHKYQTRSSGEAGENLVEAMMIKNGLTFQRQKMTQGRGHKWRPDFMVQRLSAEGVKEVEFFVEVKTQWSMGSADEKILAQILRAYRMGIKGVFVLLPMGNRVSFRPEIIADVKWVLEQIPDLGNTVQLAIGLEEAEAIITRMYQ